MSRKKYSLIGEITSFDYHGNWGDYCSPRSLKEWLATLSRGEEAEIEINSPGGSVIMGIEMANAIKNSKAKLVAHVTGIAASMASVVACACNVIEMEEASFMMIHDPWSYAEGNAEELRKQASLLDQMKAVIMSFYRGKFKGCTAEQLSALMSEETWYTGSECKENGLDCIVISSETRAAASIVGHHFTKVPDAAAKYMTAKTLTDEGRAEIEAAKNAAESAAESAADDAGAPASAALPWPQNAEAPASAALPGPQNAEAPASAAESAAESAADPAAVPGDWEARYKGASKKINELQAHIADLEKRAAACAIETIDYGAVVAERDGLKTQNAALEETAANAAKALKDFKDQVKSSGFEDLAALIGAVSGLKTDLEKSAQDLAACREQLEHMKSTRDLLTGGVLTPAAELPTLQDGLAKCKTPKERSKFIASGKYRKNK